MDDRKLISKLRVRSCDIDSFGHVNNAVYLRYFEGARNDYILESGLTFADFARWDAGPVLVSARLDFKLPTKADDELLISGVMRHQGRTRFRIDHEIVRQSDQRIVCQAQLDFAFVTLTTGRPCRMPAEFSRAFGLNEPASE
jgi:acyl-CoA thioester hydrolase